MQKLFTTFLAAFCATFSYAQQHTAEHALKGNIKTLVETYTSTETVEGDKMIDATRRTSTYNKEGKIKQVHSLSYTVGGNRQRPEWEAKMKQGFPDTVGHLEIYNYNSKGLLANVTGYIDVNGPDPSKITEYTYDDYDRQLTELSYQPFRSDAEKVMYKMTYDAGGHLSEKIKLTAEVNGEFQEAGREQYDYDPAGNMIKKFDYDYENKNYWCDYTATYDAAGRVTGSRNYLPDGTVWASSDNVYDNYGKCIESVSADSEGNRKKVVYSYEQLDRQGNFLREAVSVPGEAPHLVVQRSIEYY